MCFGDITYVCIDSRKENLIQDLNTYEFKTKKKIRIRIVQRNLLNDNPTEMICDWNLTEYSCLHDLCNFVFVFNLALQSEAE